MEFQLLVITLERTPERLEAFYKNNKDAVADLDVEVIHGIDGYEQEEINQKSRWVSESAIENWTRGAIGSALSHIKAWRRCIELDQEVLIAEDDVILARNLRSKLEELHTIERKTDQRSLILLGWNPDSFKIRNISRS